ncbi:MAG: hypothetical protein ACYCO3_09410 [Mycobacteriales bacterium]
MTAFLIDEMLPRAIAGLLRERFGHDAVHAGRKWTGRPPRG